MASTAGLYVVVFVDGTWDTAEVGNADVVSVCVDVGRVVVETV